MSHLQDYRLCADCLHNSASDIAEDIRERALCQTTIEIKIEKVRPSQCTYCNELLAESQQRKEYEKSVLPNNK